MSRQKDKFIQKATAKDKIPLPLLIFLNLLLIKGVEKVSVKEEKQHDRK